MNKWLIGGLIVVALLIVAGLLIKKSVRAEIVINASPEEVWSTSPILRRTASGTHIRSI